MPERGCFFSSVWRTLTKRRRFEKLLKIVLIMGRGNLNAPVISTEIVLKTAMTKDT